MTLSEYQLQDMLKEVAELRRINSLPYTSVDEMMENSIRLNQLREMAVKHNEGLALATGVVDMANVKPNAGPTLRIIK